MLPPTSVVSAMVDLWCGERREKALPVAVLRVESQDRNIVHGTPSPVPCIVSYHSVYIMFTEANKVCTCCLYSTFYNTVAGACRVLFVHLVTTTILGWPFHTKTSCTMSSALCPAGATTALTEHVCLYKSMSSTCFQRMVQH